MECIDVKPEVGTEGRQSLHTVDFPLFIVFPWFSLFFLGRFMSDRRSSSSCTLSDGKQNTW